MGNQTEAEIRNTFNDGDDDDEFNALSMLAPEERAAIEDKEEESALKKVAGDDEEGDQDDGKAKTKAQDESDGDDADDGEDGDDDDPDADDDGEGEEEEKGDGKQANPDSAEGNDADAGDGKQDDTEYAAEPQAPIDLSPLQAAHDAKLKELAAERAAAFKKYNDGDMSAEDFAAADEKYLNARDAARDELHSNIAWFREVHAFKGDIAKEINYDKDAEKAGSWDDWVKRLASKPEHADKPSRWFLEEAHRKVKLEYGIADATPAKASKPEKTEKAEPAKPAKPVKKAPDLTKIPKTLGGLPAAAEEAADGDSGEFAHLDGLTGMALERALAKLTPEQEARYLAG